MRGMLFLIFLCGALLTHIGWAQEDVISQNSRIFAELNPDGTKYEFVKHYLTALQHLQKVEQLQEDVPVIALNDISLEILRSRAEHLLQENVNFRVARNLVDRYRQSENGFILKVGEIFSTTCESLIALNSQERDLILSIINRDVSEMAFDGKAKEEYWAQQNEFLAQRKTISAGILEASIYVSKLLRSSQLSSGGQIFRLGISLDERLKLKEFLREFSYPADVIEIQPGQTFVEGSVAVIRQILEDDSFGTLDG